MYICKKINKIFNGQNIIYDNYNHCFIVSKLLENIDPQGNAVIVLINGLKTRSIKSDKRLLDHYVYELETAPLTEYVYLTENHHILKHTSSRKIYGIESRRKIKNYCAVTYNSARPTSWELFCADKHVKFILWILRKLPKYIRYDILILFICNQQCDYQNNIIHIKTY